MSENWNKIDMNEANRPKKVWLLERKALGFDGEQFYISKGLKDRDGITTTENPIFAAQLPTRAEARATLRQLGQFVTKDFRPSQHIITPLGGRKLSPIDRLLDWLKDRAAAVLKPEPF